MTTAISSRRLAWLDTELQEWQSDGLIDPDEARAIRSRYNASQRLALNRVVLGLGAAFVAVGTIWLVASNLDRIPPMARMGAVIALWFGLVALAEVLAVRHEARVTASRDTGSRDAGRGSPVVGAVRLLAAAAFGAGVFQAAQSLNVPAYEPALVGWWAAGAMLYAYAVTGLAPLVLAVVTATVWFIWQSADDASSNVNFVAAVLLGALVATAVSMLHVSGRRRLWGAGQNSKLSDSGVPGSALSGSSWADRFAEVWRLAAALLALLGLFVAALPIYTNDRLRVSALLVVALVVAAAVLLAAAVLGGRADRIELAAMLAVLAVAGLLVAWRPEGDLQQPTAELTGRAVLSVLAYLVVAGWYALLGVRHELRGVTWLATAALVVFTTVQSFAVFAPVISGAALFLAVGLVLIAAGYLVDRGRRKLVEIGAADEPDEASDAAPDDDRGGAS